MGLLAGDAGQEVTRAIVAIDYTRAVGEEARESKCDLVIAYHPPIFEAMKRLTVPSLVYDAIGTGWRSIRRTYCRCGGGRDQ